MLEEGKGVGTYIPQITVDLCFNQLWWCLKSTRAKLKKEVWPMLNMFVETSDEKLGIGSQNMDE